MIAGLPITGIGGLFYLLLALAMPVVEFVRLCQGRSTWTAWKGIFRQMFMQFGVLVTIGAQAALIRYLAPGVSEQGTQALGMTGIDTFSKNNTAGMVAASTLIAALTLVTVYAMVHTLRLYFALKGTSTGVKQSQKA